MGQPRIFSIIDKACYDYKMIEEGDRILVGASGGKDSTALIEYLYNRKKRLNSNFVFECVFIKTEFGKPLPPNILSCFEKWNIVLKTIDIDIEERSREDKKLGCYWCSTQRRTELLKYAIEATVNSYSPYSNFKMFRKLFSNENFQRDFYNRAEELLESNLSYENACKVVDEMVKQVEPYKLNSNKRWGLYMWGYEVNGINKAGLELTFSGMYAI